MAYGNDFSAVMQASLAERSMENAKGEAAMNRFISVMNQSAQLKQQQQQGMMAAQQATRQMAMRQAELDQQKNQFAQTFQQAAKQFEEVKGHNEWLKQKAADDLELDWEKMDLDKRRIDQAAQFGPSVEREKESLWKTLTTHSDNGELNPESFKPYVQKGLITQQQLDNFGEISKDQRERRSAQFKQDESLAKLLTKEEQLKADRAKKFPDGQPKHWWSSGSKDEYKTLSDQISSISAVTDPFRKAKSFADRFVPVETEKGMQFKPVMTPPRDFSQTAAASGPEPMNPYFASKFISTNEGPAVSEIRNAGVPYQPASAAQPQAAEPSYYGFGQSQQAMPPTAAQTSTNARLPQVRTKEDYDRIPSGTDYFDLNKGIPYHKR